MIINFNSIGNVFLEVFNFFNVKVKSKEREIRFSYPRLGIFSVALIARYRVEHSRRHVNYVHSVSAVSWSWHVLHAKYRNLSWLCIISWSTSPKTIIIAYNRCLDFSVCYVGMFRIVGSPLYSSTGFFLLLLLLLLLSRTRVE